MGAARPGKSQVVQLGEEFITGDMLTCGDQQSQSNCEKNKPSGRYVFFVCAHSEQEWWRRRYSHSEGGRCGGTMWKQRDEETGGGGRDVFFISGYMPCFFVTRFL